MSETAAALSRPLPDVEAAHRRLAEAHVIVLAPDEVDVWMAMPFSNVPTAYRVTVSGRS